MPDWPHGAAVRERLVHRKVETGVGFLEPRPVEWTTPARGGRATARRTAKRRVVDTVLEQQ